MSVPWLVAISAVETGLVQTMAVHASAHLDIRFAPKLVPLRDRSVTSLAVCAAFQVCLVGERNVARNFINAYPWNRPVLRRVRRQSLNGGTVFLHGLMAAHALRRRWNAHCFPRVRHLMTGFAFETEGNVLFVAVGNGLHGCRLRYARPGCQAQRACLSLIHI